jgi:hypothetical protein
MKKKTLVIHPKDPSTDFLCEIYRDRGFTEIKEGFEADKLKTLIHEHQRIVLLGHGYHNGLLNYYETIIDDSFATLLAEKEVVGIWCYAKAFFERHQLGGFHTDMFISEPDEATIMGISANKKSIDISNRVFAKAVRKNLFRPDCYNRIIQYYKSLSSPVALFNQERLYYRSATGDLQGCENPSIANWATNFVNENLSDLSAILRDNPGLLSALINKTK